MMKKARPVVIALAIATTPACLTSSHQAASQEMSSSVRRSAWRQRLNWPQSCERAFGETRDKAQAGNGIRSFRLASGWQLIEVGCAAGAYQPSQMFVGLSPTGMPTAPLSLPVVEFDDRGEPRWATATEAWGTVTFDEATGQLSITNVARGVGDCGSLIVYRFDADGVIHVDVVSARGKACDDHSQAPASWPRIR